MQARDFCGTCFSSWIGWKDIYITSPTVRSLSWILGGFPLQGPRWRAKVIFCTRTFQVRWFLDTIHLQKGYSIHLLEAASRRLRQGRPSQVVERLVERLTGLTGNPVELATWAGREASPDSMSLETDIQLLLRDSYIIAVGSTCF